MTKVTVEQRILERLDQQITALDRLAAAIEQQNALTARGVMGIVGTSPGLRAGPLKHYNPKEQTNEQSGKVRVRPARG